MIDNVLWWVWHVGEFVAVVCGWYVLLGFLRGVCEAVKAIHNQHQLKRER